MAQPRKTYLKEQLARRYRAFSDQGSQALAASIEAAVMDADLADVAERALSLTPHALDRLRVAMTGNLDRIEAAVAEKERQRAVLDRSPIDDLIFQLDDNVQILADLLRRLLPDLALNPSNIEFAELVLLPISTSLQQAVEQSDKAQGELFSRAISLAKEALESQHDEAMVLLEAADTRLGGGILCRPVMFPYRPPEYFFIAFYSTVDTYERVRVSTQGMGLLHAIRPRWLRSLLQRLPEVAGMSFGEIVGGVAGYDSLSVAKRTALRRELAGIAAEQRHRVLSSALEQACIYHRELKVGVLRQARGHYFAMSDELSRRLSDLANERRKTHQYWSRAERLLTEADAIARELLSLIQRKPVEPRCIA